MKEKPWILMISHVWPVPGSSGQEMRVFYMLKALSANYRVTFLTFGSDQKIAEFGNKLEEHCTEVVLLPSIYQSNSINKIYFKGLGELYAKFTGLKFSNFIINHCELSSIRVRKALPKREYKAVFFEYWHAHGAARYFRKQGIPTVLDMHNILWQTYKAQRLERGLASQRAFRKYRAYEEKVWEIFDVLIAINQRELDYVMKKPSSQRRWLVPMGIDLNKWPAKLNNKNQVPKLAYYGGLGSLHNQKSALLVLEQVMPRVWVEFPDAQLYIIGSNPPEELIQLGNRKNVTVTGYVEKIETILSEMDMVLCPWEGTYGFRSRIVEVMATGTPVLTTDDAVDGMDLIDGKGIFLDKNMDNWAAKICELLSKNSLRTDQRSLARSEIENKFGLSSTYEKINGLLNAL
jgi:glycosyltransferase involved in cell wall biosynthesis